MSWEDSECDLELRVARLDAAATVFAALWDLGADEYERLLDAAEKVLMREFRKALGE